MFIDSTLPLTFKKLLLAEFGCGIEEGSSQLFIKAIKTLLPFSTIYVRTMLNFLHLLQPKKHITED